MKGKVRCHSLAHYDISNRNVIVVSSVVYRSFEIVVQIKRFHSYKFRLLKAFDPIS